MAMARKERANRKQVGIFITSLFREKLRYVFRFSKGKEMRNENLQVHEYVVWQVCDDDLVSLS